MALYAFDGTWNESKTDDAPQLSDTNVVRFYRAYHRSSTTPTFDYYLAGVGTSDPVDHILGGFFGLGELSRIDKAYDQLCAAWAAGDRIIDVVGFSRGAATTLDFCNRIASDGIRKPGSDQVVEPNPKIRFLGVWDVVAAFGLANLGNAALNIGHHLSLPGSNLQYCFHALALDERRPSFLPTRLKNAREVWFRGVHADVGGGNGNIGLNNIALKWMMSKAKAAGLPIVDADIAALSPDSITTPEPHPNLPILVRAISAIDRHHYTVAPMGDWTTPSGGPQESKADEQIAIPLGAQSLEVWPHDERLHFVAMCNTATAVAKARDCEIGSATEALAALFRGRAVLITDDATLKKTGESIVLLLNTMIDQTHRNGFNTLHEVDLNEALFRLYPLFPFTD